MKGNSGPASIRALAAGYAVQLTSHSSHRYHGAFRVALVLVALLIVVAAVALLVVLLRRRAGGRRLPRRERGSTQWPASGHRPRALAAAVCWLLALWWFVGQAIAQAAWTSPYSVTRDYISDLGVTQCGTYRLLGESSYICSPLYEVMNATFILVGLLVIAGAALLTSARPRRPALTAGLVLIGADGIGKVGAGLVPGNVNAALHDTASFGILAGGVGALLLGYGLWRYSRWRSVGFLTVGIVASGAFLLMAVAPSFHLPVGLFERLASWPLSAWLAVIALALILPGRSTARTSPSPSEGQGQEGPRRSASEPG